MIIWLGMKEPCMAEATNGTEEVPTVASTVVREGMELKNEL